MCVIQKRKMRLHTFEELKLMIRASAGVKKTVEQTRTRIYSLDMTLRPDRSFTASLYSHPGGHRFLPFFLSLSPSPSRRSIYKIVKASRRV